MPYTWRRPTPAQAKRGIIAVHVYTWQCWNDKDQHMVSCEQPCPYYTHNIKRRIARGDDLPYWIEVIR